MGQGLHLAHNRPERWLLPVGQPSAHSRVPRSGTGLRVADRKLQEARTFTQAAPSLVVGGMLVSQNSLHLRSSLASAFGTFIKVR